jgi:hypothetical protein
MNVQLLVNTEVQSGVTTAQQDTELNYVIPKPTQSSSVGNQYSTFNSSGSTQSLDSNAKSPQQFKLLDNCNTLPKIDVDIQTDAGYLRKEF